MQVHLRLGETRDSGQNSASHQSEPRAHASPLHTWQKVTFTLTNLKKSPFQPRSPEDSIGPRLSAEGKCVQNGKTVISGLSSKKQRRKSKQVQSKYSSLTLTELCSRLCTSRTIHNTAWVRRPNSHLCQCSTVRTNALHEQSADVRTCTKCKCKFICIRVCIFSKTFCPCLQAVLLLGVDGKNTTEENSFWPLEVSTA